MGSILFKKKRHDMKKYNVQYKEIVEILNEAIDITNIEEKLFVVGVLALLIHEAMSDNSDAAVYDFLEDAKNSVARTCSYETNEWFKHNSNKVLEYTRGLYEPDSNEFN